MGVIKVKGEKLPRKHSIQILLNEKEKKVLDNYCKKYRISNRSKFIRELVVSEILEQLDKDYPSLFDNIQPKNTEA